jgi:hypothetical protein
MRRIAGEAAQTGRGRASPSPSNISSGGEWRLGSHVTPEDIRFSPPPFSGVVSVIVSKGGPDRPGRPARTIAGAVCGPAGEVSTDEGLEAVVKGVMRAREPLWFNAG